MLMFKLAGLRGSITEGWAGDDSTTLGPLKTGSASGILSTGTTPTSGSSAGFFPQPSTGGFMPGGFMMPGTPMPGMMPGMPLQPGMPGYVAPTPWYSGVTGIVLLGAAALIAFKLLSD